MQCGLGKVWIQFVLHAVSPLVRQGQDTLYNAWAGGWNSPQFSVIDIDGDGQVELFVYDRVDDRCMLFRREGGRWRYLPQADTLFPQQLLSAWVLLRDYDGDGDKDLFTNLNSNIRILKNIAPVGSPPRWQVAYDTLKTEYAPNFASYLYSGRVDIPAITDIDGDGDIDLLVYEVLGTLIEWHKNEAVERLGRRDTLLLRLQSSCWGHVFEQYDYTTNQFSFVEYQCGTGQREEESPFHLGQGRVEHAGGSILAIDLNGDRLKDLIVGDDGPPYLIAGLNVGTPHIAHIDINSTIAPFPAHAPLFLPSFPATYYEDVTGDGIPDLLCANNSPLAGEDRRSVWLYENIGRPDSPQWAHPVIGWLHTSMLDVGTSAHPTLADINRDGFLDLIISSESFFTSRGAKCQAFLLLGDSSGFTLVDTNWLDLPQYNLRNPVFAVGDVDGNGRLDLIMGTSTGALWRWEEQTAGGANFTLLTQNFGGISASPFAAPLLYDYDRDGDLDLIVGARNGRLSLYKQEANGQFVLISSFLGGIELRDTVSTLLGFARPALADVDGDGKAEMIVGNMTGLLRVYEPLWEAPEESWSLIADLPYRWGKRASPTAGQVGDSLLLLVGNLRGGVHAFQIERRDSHTSLHKAPSKPYSLYLTEAGWVFSSEKPARLSIHDWQGRQLYSLDVRGIHLLPPMAAGLYLLCVHVASEVFLEKLW